jgi:hypothetical protein
MMSTLNTVGGACHLASVGNALVTIFNLFLKMKPKKGPLKFVVEYRIDCSSTELSIVYWMYKV